MYTISPIKKLITVESFVMTINAIRPKDFYFAGEMHNFWEAVYVKSGHAAATGDEKVYNLSTGNLLFHKPMQFHRIWSSGDSTPHLKIISFIAKGEGMNSFNDRCLLLTPEESDNFEKVFEALSEFEKIRDSRNYKYEAYSYYSSIAASRLEAFLLSLLSKKAVPQEHSSPSEEHFRKIVKVMQEHCTENLSLDDLSALCLMSKSNMKRIFSKYSDIGIAKYFLNIKMRKAMELLENGYSAAETAEMLSFSEASYFHNVFKRELGITPCEYKKRHLK